MWRFCLSHNCQVVYLSRTTMWGTFFTLKNTASVMPWRFFYCPIPASFCSLSSVSQANINFNNINWKKSRWCAWDENQGPLHCRRRQNHGALEVASGYYTDSYSLIARVYLGTVFRSKVPTHFYMNWTHEFWNKTEVFSAVSPRTCYLIWENNLLQSSPKMNLQIIFFSSFFRSHWSVSLTMPYRRNSGSCLRGK